MLRQKFLSPSLLKVQSCSIIHLVKSHLLRKYLLSVSFSLLCAKDNFTIQFSFFATWCVFPFFSRSQPKNGPLRMIVSQDREAANHKQSKVNTWWLVVESFSRLFMFLVHFPEVVKGRREEKSLKMLQAEKWWKYQ